MDFTGERLVPDQKRDDDLYHEHVIRYMFAAQFGRGRRVLDAGCGAGYGAALLAEAGAQSVLGVDVASDAIAYAGQRYRQAGLSFAVLDIARLSLPAASFDLVVSFEVIEHLDDPAALPQAAARLLAEDGLFIVSTPNPATYPAGNPFHKHEMALDEFVALLRRSFPALSIFEQDYTTALALRPSAAAVALAPDVFAPAVERTPRQADYYVALCARQAEILDQALAAAHGIIYELPSDRLGERIRDALTLQRLLDNKDSQIAQKDGHIAHLEGELHRQGAWAADLERQLLALRNTWYGRLFGRFKRRS